MIATPLRPGYVWDRCRTCQQPFARLDIWPQQWCSLRHAERIKRR